MDDVDRNDRPNSVAVMISTMSAALADAVRYTNQRGHRSYWQTLEEFQAMVDSFEK